jgi:hypothetical protein
VKQNGFPKNGIAGSIPEFSVAGRILHSAFQNNKCFAGKYPKRRFLAYGSIHYDKVFEGIANHNEKCKCIDRNKDKGEHRNKKNQRTIRNRPGRRTMPGEKPDPPAFLRQKLLDSNIWNRSILPFHVPD